MMRILFCLAAILFAATSAQAQTNVWEKYNLTTPVHWKTGFRTEEENGSFSKAERIQIGMKFITGWDLWFNQKDAEELFGEGPYPEQTLISFIGLNFMSKPRENEKKMHSLTKGMKEGDSVSAKLLGIIMYIYGNKMFNGRNRAKEPDLDSIALLYAAHHFGFDKAAAVINGQYYLLSNNRLKNARNRSREYIRNPLRILELPALRCEEKSRMSSFLCIY